MEEKIYDVTPYLAINLEERSVRYLGYILPLTATEFEILRVIALAENGIDKQTVAELVAKRVKMSARSLSVHICSVNKKARGIGGRNLVKMCRSKGYFVEK